MKGKNKYIVPLLLAGVTATGIVADFQQKDVYINAATTETVENKDITDIEGAELRVSPFAKTCNVSAETAVELPDCTIENGDGTVEIEYIVKNGDITIDVIPATGTTNASFMPIYEGAYNITINAKKNGKIVSSISNLSIQAVRADAVISLPVNSKYVIPAQIPTNQAGLKIPAPSVVITDDEGKETEKTAYELKSSTTEELKVYITTPDKQLGLNGDVPTTLDVDGEYFAVDTVANPNYLSKPGTYTIVYEYISDNAVISRLKSNFQVVEDLKVEDIKLKMTFDSSVPTSGNVKTDVKIPSVTVTEEGSTDEINAYVEVLVENVRNKQEKVKVTYGKDGITFFPESEGYYAVTYVAKIELFGESCKTSQVIPGDVIEIKDKKAPTLIPTYAYTFDDNGEISTVKGEPVAADTENNKTQRQVAEELLVNRRVDVPSVAILKTTGESSSVTVKVPAAYAIDNFYTFKGANNDEIKITRTYRTPTGKVDSVVYLTGDKQGQVVPANEEGEIVFNSTGNAQIRYQATDKANNTLGEVVYDLVIYASDKDVKDGETKVNLNVGSTIISDKEKTLTFAKPTATDTYDTSVEVRTFYQVSGEVNPVELTDKDLKDGKYSIDVSSLGGKTIDVYSIAYVDETLVGTRGDEDDSQLKENNQVKSKVYTVKVLAINNDAGHATFAMESTNTWNQELYALNEDVITKDKLGAKLGTGINEKGNLVNGSTEVQIGTTGEYYAPFDQGKTVLKLPAVTFTEDSDSNMTIRLSITDKFGNRVSKVDQEEITMDEVGTKYKYTVSGASFKLSSYGVYTVTYTAKDFAGNITVKSFGIKVNDKTAPTIIIDEEDRFGKEIEVGEKFEVPSARLIKNEEEISGTWRWEIYDQSASADCDKSFNSFVPTSEGTFFIRYWAQDIYGNEAVLEDAMFIVTAKDTKKPTITVDPTVNTKDVMAWAPKTGESFMRVEIPVATAQDKITGESLKVSYAVVGPNGSAPEVLDYKDDDTTAPTYKKYVKYFNATSQGTYKVTYSTSDSAGNESTKTVEIAIGDCTAPTITLKEDANIPTEMALNTQYTLDLNSLITQEKLVLKDDETTKENLLKKLTIKLMYEDNTTVTNLISSSEGGYKWDLSKAGKYTLQFTVKDEVGNTSKTITRTFEVPTEDADENKVNPVLGTVLIVLSVVVLSGVVVYFVASSKKKGKKAPKKSK